MPFGVALELAFFLYIMQLILAEDNLITAVVYLDNVTVVGRDSITCWQNVLLIIGHLTDVGMKLSPKKFFVLCPEITILAHHLFAGILCLCTK